MTSFDFSGALASGATPQAITSYLSSQGMGNLATTYFNQQPATPSSFDQAVSALKGFAGNALNTLLVTPATKIAEAGASAAEPLLPQTTQENIEANLQKPQTSLGQTVEPQATGTKGVEEIAGQALNSAAYLAAPEGLGAEGTLGEKVLQGAGTGAGVGAAGGAGNALQDPNATLGSVATEAGKGAAVGAAVGGAIPAAGALPGAASDIANNLEKAPPASTNSLDTAVSLTRGVQDEKYQLQAAAEDSRNIAQDKPATRTTFNNGILDTTKIAPSTKEVTIAKSIQPLVDSGEVDPAKPYTENAGAVQKNINSEVARVRAGADALGVKLEATPEDIKSVFTKTELPNKMGADETQTRLAAKFQQSIMDIAAKSKDLLDFQQQFSKQAVKDFGEDVFANPRNPAQEYLGELRNNFNDLIQSKFPDGKLPEGDTFKAAQKNISNMIQAKEGLIENGVRGNQVGSNKITRALDKSPVGKALGRRVAMREATSGIIKGATAAGAVGLGALGYAAAKKK